MLDRIDWRLEGIRREKCNNQLLHAKDEGEVQINDDRTLHAVEGDSAGRENGMADNRSQNDKKNQNCCKVRALVLRALVNSTA
jgi:hypothetical protein